MSQARSRRILLVVSSLSVGKGGTERIASNLANDLSDNGYCVYVAYKDKGTKSPSYHLNTSVVLLPYDKPQQLNSFVREGRLDIVVVFYVSDSNLIPFVQLATLHKVPVVLQESTDPDRCRFNNWREGQVSRAKASWEREVWTSAAARIRLVMPNYRNSFAAFQKPMVFGFPNGAKVTTKRAQPATTTDGRFRILIINGHKVNKNLKEALRAFISIASLFPDWDFRIVGPQVDWESTHFAPLYREVTESDLWNRIEVTGVVEDMEEQYRLGHIHVLSSLSEGCPTAVLEAMAAGLPSIGFARCPGTNELIQHDRNGLLVESDDRVGGLSLALSRLMSNPMERDTLGRQALEDSRKLDPSKVLNQWEELLVEASQYKNSDVDRLLSEQQAIDHERALSARRMRNRLGKA